MPRRTSSADKADAQERARTEFDEKRNTEALKHLETFREKVSGVLAQEEAQKSEKILADRRRFCSDDTLLRYLRARDSDEAASLALLQSTLSWRETTLFTGAGGTTPVCEACGTEPCSHCFFRVGTDIDGNEVMYSCAARAVNKDPQANCRHMACEVERIFKGNSVNGRIVWLIDFNGFGVSDCNPRMGATVLPAFANHYPERMSQIVWCAAIGRPLEPLTCAVPGLEPIASRRPGTTPPRSIDPPMVFYALLKGVQPVLDPVTASKIKVIKGDAAFGAYADAKLQHDVAMHNWLLAVRKRDGKPGCLPEPALSQALDDETTRLYLERIAARGDATPRKRSSASGATQESAGSASS